MKLSAQTMDDAHTLRCALAGEILRSSGSLHLRVSGWSMLPTVWPGDTLVIEPASGGQVCEGDLVLFSAGRRFVAHRVVAIGHDSGRSTVRTQGDAATYADSPLAVSDIMGKVSRIRRSGRCIEPSRRLRFSERSLAAVFRRSSLAARFVVAIRGTLQKFYGPSSVPASRVQTASI